ncbi:MAG: HmuY family protein [Bacteroidota bacterium]
MKRIHTLFYLALLSGLLIFTGCSEDEDAPAPVDLEVEEITDLPADPDRAGDFTFFSFENGIVASSLSSTASWDVAFSGTAILTNGGSSGPGEGAAQIVPSSFEGVTEAPADGYREDTEAEPAIVGSDGWYSYTGEAPSGPKHAVLTIPGRIIVLKTAEGNYAKMEILSYYEGNPDPSTAEFVDLQTRPTSRHYTFRYVVQPNGSRQF